jgi:hypothetical protein
MALNMKRDNGGAAIQAFCPDPAMCQVPQAIANAATYTLERATIPISFIRFLSTGAVQVYLNGQTTAYLTFQANTIYDLALDDNVTSISFVNNTGAGITLEIWGR